MRDSYASRQLFGTITTSTLDSSSLDFFKAAAAEKKKKKKKKKSGFQGHPGIWSVSSKKIMGPK